MAAKRIIVWVAVSISLFIAANGASYFLRSSGYGVIQVNDGILRAGFPFVMFERGGIDGHELFSASAALGNLLVASITAAFALGISKATQRHITSRRHLFV